MLCLTTGNDTNSDCCTGKIEENITRSKPGRCGLEPVHMLKLCFIGIRHSVINKLNKLSSSHVPSFNLLSSEYDHLIQIPACCASAPFARFDRFY